MAPSYSELGLNIGDSAVLSESGAKDLDEKYNLGINKGALVTVIDKKDYCKAEEMAFLRFDESKAVFIINKDWDLFEEPKK
jgi:hypothetical protein